MITNMYAERRRNYSEAHLMDIDLISSANVPKQ